VYVAIQRERRRAGPATMPQTQILLGRLFTRQAKAS